MATAPVKAQAEDAAEERVLDALVPPPRAFGDTSDADESTTRQRFRKMLREGKLNDKEIEIELAQAPGSVEIMAPPGMEEMTEQIKSMFSGLGTGRTKSRKLKIAEAM